MVPEKWWLVHFERQKVAISIQRAGDCGCAFYFYILYPTHGMTIGYPIEFHMLGSIQALNRGQKRCLDVMATAHPEEACFVIWWRFGKFWVPWDIGVCLKIGIVCTIYHQVVVTPQAVTLGSGSRRSGRTGSTNLTGVSRTAVELRQSLLGPGSWKASGACFILFLQSKWIRVIHFGGENQPFAGPAGSQFSGLGSQEKKLNSFPHFTLPVNGLKTHFIHQRSTAPPPVLGWSCWTAENSWDVTSNSSNSSHQLASASFMAHQSSNLIHSVATLLRFQDPNAIPLLLVHGWPGSIVEFLPPGSKWIPTLNQASFKKFSMREISHHITQYQIVPSGELTIRNGKWP